MVAVTRLRSLVRAGSIPPRGVPLLMVVPVLIAVGESPLKRLPPDARIRVLLGLLVLVLLGLSLLAVIWLSGRWIRRMIRSDRRRNRPGPIGPSDWEPGGMTARMPAPPGGDHDRHA